MKDGISIMRVLNTLGSLTSQSTVAEQLALAALRPFVAKDNVHLTSEGYWALAEGIFREAQNFGVSRMKGKHSRLFWAQMALASLVAISRPKKVSIFRTHPFQCPS